MCQRAHNIQLCEYLWYVVLKKKKSELCLSQLWFKEPLMWGDLQFVWVIRPILKICIYAFKRSKCFPDLPVSEHFTYCHSSEVTFDDRSRSTTFVVVVAIQAHVKKPWLISVSERWKLWPLTSLSSLLGMQLWRWDSTGVDWTNSGHTVDRPRPGQRTAQEGGLRRPIPDEGWSQLAFPRSEPIQGLSQKLVKISNVTVLSGTKVSKRWLLNANNLAIYSIIQHLGKCTHLLSWHELNEVILGQKRL